MGSEACRDSALCVCLPAGETIEREAGGGARGGRGGTAGGTAISDGMMFKIKISNPEDIHRHAQGRAKAVNMQVRRLRIGSALP